MKLNKDTDPAVSVLDALKEWLSKLPHHPQLQTSDDNHCNGSISGEWGCKF
jgi:hypothetical protein